MDRRCVALRWIDRAAAPVVTTGERRAESPIGRLREALAAAGGAEVTPQRRLGSGTEWERMRAGLRRLGLEPPGRWETWPAGGGRRGGRRGVDGEEAGEGGRSKEGAENE